MGEIVLFALLFLLAITDSHNFCKFRLQMYYFFLTYANFQDFFCKNRIITLYFDGIDLQFSRVIFEFKRNPIGNKLPLWILGFLY